MSAFGNPLVARLAVGVLLALVLAAIFAADGYQIYIIALVGLTAVVGVGLNVLLGLTGQISLGHVGFYAIGAYVAAILTADAGWSFWIAWPLAGLAAGLAGTLLAIPALRVSGPYLAMVTIAFGFVVEQGAAEWKGLTGGWNGIMNIPVPELFGLRFEEQGIALLIAALATAAFLMFARLAVSPWGLAMRATRDSEIAAQSLGLNPVAIRTAAFALSAVLTGLAGALFAPITAFISPESFPFFQSILFLLVVMIGGTGTVLGPLIGALVIVLLPEFLSFLAEYRLLFVGALLLVVLRLAPEGVVGTVQRLLPQKTVASREPAPVETVTPAISLEGHAEPLRIEGLTISFGGVHAVAEVDLEARPGQVTSIIGPNGAGKTTLLNMMGGFYKPDAGSIRLGERELAGLPGHGRALAPGRRHGPPRRGGLGLRRAGDRDGDRVPPAHGSDRPQGGERPHRGGRDQPRAGARRSCDPGGGRHVLRVVAKMAGITLPIRSFPLQAMVTQPLKPFLDPLVSSSALHCYVSQTARGELVIGGGSDPYELYSTRSTLDLKESLIAHALEMFPFLSEVRLLRQWAGITDMTPDYSPIMGESPVRNYWLDAGWGTWGFKATPVCGKRMAETIAREKAPAILEPFRLDRFRTFALTNEMGATAASH